MTTLDKQPQPDPGLMPPVALWVAEGLHLLLTGGSATLGLAGMKAPAREGTLKILLVDDESDDCLLFGAALVKAGLTNVRLQTVRDGDQAIHYLEGKGAFRDRTTFPLPDLVVLDLIMPRVHGTDFLSWQKTSGELSKIPVVVLTQVRDKAEIEAAVRAGALTAFSKECNFDRWTNVVSEIVNFGFRLKRIRPGQTWRPQ